jgi:hypothetical protein
MSPGAPVIENIATMQGLGAEEGPFEAVPTTGGQDQMKQEPVRSTYLLRNRQIGGLLGAVRNPPAGVALPTAIEKEKAAAAEMSVLISLGVFEAVEKLTVRQQTVVYLAENYEWKRGAWAARSCAGGNLLPVEDSWSANTTAWGPGLILIKAALQDFVTMTFDFPRAYLNANMDRPAFIKLNPAQAKRACETRPEWRRLLDSNGSLYVQVKKALYGFRQSGLLWNETLAKSLTDLGFRRSKLDPSMYVLEEHGVLLTVYVDDGMMAGPKVVVQGIMDTLEAEFGELKKHYLEKVGDQVKFVGTRVTKIEGGYTLDQEELIEEIHLAAKNVDLSNYRSVLMKTAYVVNRTRNEFGFILSALSSLQDKPTLEAVQKLKKLAYDLHESKDAKIYLVPEVEDEDFVISSDASHASHEDLKGQAGNAFKVKGVTFHNTSRKIKETCLSATEAELVALISALKEAIFFKELIEDMGLFAIRNYEVEEDNRGVLELIKNRKLPARTRHLGIKLEFVRDVVEEGIFHIKYVSGPSADVLTKEFGKATREKLAEKVGVRRRDVTGVGKFRGSVGQCGMQVRTYQSEERE